MRLNQNTQRDQPADVHRAVQPFLNIPLSHADRAIIHQVSQISTPNQCPEHKCVTEQCFGSGSGWIRISWPDPDPLRDPGSKKNIVINSNTNQPKLQQQ